MKTQFLRFVLVGMTATLTTYIVLIVLVEVWQVNAVVASVIDYLIGIGVNYILNYCVTFQSDQFHRTVLTMFLTVMIVGLGLNVAIMHAGVNRFDLYYVLAQLVTDSRGTGVELCCRLWAFAA